MKVKLLQISAFDTRDEKKNKHTCSDLIRYAYQFLLFQIFTQIQYIRLVHLFTRILLYINNRQLVI
jgi:hypothetical protein